MIDVIILGPGGIKGFLELGSLYYLERNNLLANVKTYIGVSIGSLLSLLMVSGYSVMDILLEFLDVDINSKNVNILSLSKDFGLLDMNNIKIKLEEMLINKWGKVLNMKELYDCTGIDYISVSTNNSTKKEECISKDNFPKMECTMAAILSMNIPVIFKKLSYRGVLYTDGVISLPYPSLKYDNKKDNILCIHVYSNKYEVDNILQYIFNNINIITNQMKDIAIEKASDKCKFIFLKTKSIDIIGNSTNIKDKVMMFREGYIITEKKIKLLYNI